MTGLDRLLHRHSARHAGHRLLHAVSHPIDTLGLAGERQHPAMHWARRPLVAGREHPVLCAAIAAGAVGFVVGWFCAQRRRSHVELPETVQGIAGYDADTYVEDPHDEDAR